MAICVRQGADFIVQSEAKDECGRVNIITGQNDGKSLTICNIYAPNEDNLAFFFNMYSRVQELIDHLIIIGDFNLTFDQDLDVHNVHRNNTKAVAILQEIMNENMLVDIWRVRNPEEKKTHSLY